MFFESWLTHFPWLITLVILGGGGCVLLQRTRALRRALEAEQRAHELARTDVVSAHEKLDAKSGEAERVRNEFERRRSELDARIKLLERKTEDDLERISTLRETNAGLEAKLHEQGRLGSQQSKEFENLANRILEEKQEKFNELSKMSVESLLNPVRQQLTDFRKRVDDIYDSENKDRASLRTEFSQLKGFYSEALNLAKVLKGDSKVRGNWGEVILERLLEGCGLTKGREFEAQSSFISEDGKRYQPDIVLYLPENKHIIIDSKVSLVAYDQYFTSEDEDGRKRHSDAHVASLRAHINALSSKRYEELLGVNSPDFVFMFVPIEPALSLALEHQPDLNDEAIKKGVVLVSPSMLLMNLKLVYYVWRQEHQQRNTLQIASEAGKMYDKFVDFFDSLEKVGQALGKAQEAFETANKRLKSGTGNLVGRAEKLKQLGIKTKKSLPEELLEEDNEGVRDDIGGQLLTPPSSHE
ncbi:MAG TPA: DNA recombination protein RmuC [Gammaproteobacteria bacterium]|nr:DNA recombination protein RmuC [Gammaproteobacteria bacterium]|tara:strand:- start:260 stop:1669 length:1410 start_codon:yes stop_codon:yes gene_type:complete